MFQAKLARRSETAIGNRLHAAPALVFRSKCFADLEADAKFSEMAPVLIRTEIPVNRIEQEVAVAELVSCSQGNA